MFFFPLRTDRQLASTPWLNYALIAVNILIFLFTAKQVADAHTFAVGINQAADFDTFMQLRLKLDELWVPNFYLDPAEPRLIQFFTYQYLHADVWHLLGNMVFLFVFGNSVEDRLGKVGYFAFYTACGVVAGLAHTTLDGTPILGASGSIAGVTGAYLALFPSSNVTIFYWVLVAVGTFEVSSVVLILFRVAQDLIFQSFGFGGTAYLAHLAGYLMGFVVGMGLLATRVLPREPYDLISMMERRHRRGVFQRMVKRGHRPWEHEPDAPEVDIPVKPTPPAVLARRADVDVALQRNDLPAAAEAYRQLTDLDDEQVMSQQAQLDLANHFMAEGDHAEAARAYEGFLRVHRTYADKPRIQLILGLIYARYLAQRDRARQLLEEAAQRLAGDDRDLARNTLAQLGG
ncbi:MAG: rhomboid family intramembrane serine protease [Planctomycetota bacterium]